MKGFKMKTITFLNSKGGVGKTTLCANLAYAITHSTGLAAPNRKVILVDSDPQGSLRDWHNTNENQYITRYEQLICADTRQSLLTSYRIANESGFDFMLVDTAGRMHETVGCALSFTDLAIIPLQPSALDVWATIDSIDLIKAVMRGNANLKALFVINMAIPNCSITSEVLEALKEAAPDIPIISPTICGRVSFARAAATGRTVYHTTDHKAHVEINLLCEQVLKVLEG